MKKVKILCMFLLVIMFIGCGKEKNEESSASNKETVVLTNWTSSPIEKAALEKIIKEFEEKNTDIKIELRTVAGEYNDYLKTQFSAGAGPDIFYIDSSAVQQYIELGALDEISDYDTSDFYPRLIDAFKKDGKLYGIPKDYSTLALFYNKDIMKEYGIEIKDSMTWENFLNINKTLSKLNMKGFGFTGDLARLDYLVEVRDGNTEKNGMANLTDEKVIGALTDFFVVYKDGYALTPKEVGKEWGGDLFAARDVAMVMEGPWLMPFLDENFKDLNYGTVEMPLNSLGNKGTAAFVVSYSINKNSKVKESARIFLNFMTAKETMEKWSRATDLLPSRMSVANKMNLKEDEFKKSFVKGMEYSYIWTGSANKPLIITEFANYIDGYLNGTTTLEEAMESAEKSANDSIKWQR
jgi:multiple sugar transport system substrate-binding protein